MYTRCPECSTCFRVTDRHLAIAKGKVRCGHCQLVFNAPDNAVDDLPVEQLTSQPTSKPAAAPTAQTKQAEVKKSTSRVKEEKITAAIPEKEEPLPQTAEPEIFKETKSADKKKEAAVFEADATMVADINNLNNDEFDNIDLDSIPATGNEMDDDDIFDDNFDLNAAIDELTQATENRNEDNPFLVTRSDKKEIKPEPEAETEAEEKFIPNENHNGDVFDTDAYNATSAGSVADILNEMEGQMSLDIGEPEPEPEKSQEKEYDANSEFDFLKLDEETTEDKLTGETDNNTAEDEFEIIELDEDDDEIEEDEITFELENEQEENKQHQQNGIDEEALFDQVDLSDFNDSEVAEKIVLENSEIETENEINIGKHADDYEVPLQLRNDLDNLNTRTRRIFSPIYAYPFMLFLLVLSFSQLSYFRAHELVKLVPSARPLLEAFCDTMNCHYSGPRDIKQIQLLSRDVRLHPKEKNALLISAAMINNAYFAQPYPDIHIRLSDISGNVIAERVFNAKTYMGKISNPFLLMKSKTPVHINFEVVDPGKDAINFEFSFL